MLEKFIQYGGLYFKGMQQGPEQGHRAKIRNSEILNLDLMEEDVIDAKGAKSIGRASPPGKRK